MPGTATAPVILQELKDTHFDKGVTVANKVSIRVSPLSPLTYTSDNGGIILRKPVFYSVVTTTPNTFDVNNASADLTVPIRRDGNVGIKSSPTSSLHTTSFAASIVTHTTAGTAYTSTIKDHTIVLPFGLASSGVTLHDASLAPDQVMVIVNASAISQPINGAIVGFDGVSITSLAAESSHTIQSDGVSWILIDRFIPNTMTRNRVFRSSAIATAIAGTTCSLGQFTFRYSANATGGTLEVQAVGAATIPIIFHGNRQQPGATITYTTASYTVPAAGATWSTIALGGTGFTNEILRYKLTTSTNIYTVVIVVISSARVLISVEKAV